MPLLSSYCLGCAFTPDITGWWFAIAADPCDKLPPPDHQVLGEYTRKDSCWTLATREKVVDCVKIEAPHPLSLADVMTSPRFEAVAVAAAATPLKVINSYGDAHRRLLTLCSLLMTIDWWCPDRATPPYSSYVLYQVKCVCALLQDGPLYTNDSIAPVIHSHVNERVILYSVDGGRAESKGKTKKNRLEHRRTR